MPVPAYDIRSHRCECEEWLQMIVCRKLGYIPEKDNVVFARLMDAGKLLTAKVKHIEPKGSFRMINISIYLVDF